MNILISSNEPLNIHKLLQEIKGMSKSFDLEKHIRISADNKSIQLTLDESNALQNSLIKRAYDIANMYKNDFKFIAPDVRKKFEAGKAPVGVIKTEWDKLYAKYSDAINALELTMPLVKDAFKQLDEGIVNYNPAQMLEWFEKKNMVNLTAYSEIKKYYEAVLKYNNTINVFCANSYTFSEYLKAAQNTNSMQSHSTAVIHSMLTMAKADSKDESVKQVVTDSKQSVVKTPEKPLELPKIKQMQTYVQASPYLYHGIGMDLTKLTLISRHGIMTAADGEEMFSDLYVQSHGVTEHSSSGGTNKKNNLSASKFDTTSFNDYNKLGISFMIHKDKLGQTVIENAKGVVPGEVHIEGSIKKEKITSIYVPKEILNVSVKDIAGKGVLTGSTTSVKKCQAFLNRVNYIFKYKDASNYNQILELASALDSLYATNVANTKEARDSHQAKIAKTTETIENSLGEYFQRAIGKPCTLKEYLLNQDLCGYQAIIFQESVYTKPSVPQTGPSPAPNSIFK